MTSFLPDVNVWIALSVSAHFHREISWNWLRHLPADAQIVFTRYTQVGLLRLLTNQSVMGSATLTLRQAWKVYDFWVDDPRIDLHPEPRSVEAGFRDTTESFAAKAASKWIGDCYLLAYAHACGATLVTFDKGLLALARKHGYPAISPA